MSPWRRPGRWKKTKGGSARVDAEKILWGHNPDPRLGFHRFGPFMFNSKLTADFRWQHLMNAQNFAHEPHHLVGKGAAPWCPQGRCLALPGRHTAQPPTGARPCTRRCMVSRLKTWRSCAGARADSRVWRQRARAGHEVGHVVNPAKNKQIVIPEQAGIQGAHLWMLQLRTARRGESSSSFRSSAAQFIQRWRGGPWSPACAGMTTPVNFAGPAMSGNCDGAGIKFKHLCPTCVSDTTHTCHVS